jgi:hypothetical protein
MLGLANGSVGLVRSGSERQFTLDPAARTYFVTDPVATENAPTGELHIERTANYDTILGHRAQRIVVSSSEAMTDSSGKSVQFKTEVETWCAQEPKLPKSVADATKMGLMLLGRGNRKQYDAICPVALRSRLRTLWSPGVELSWSVTAIEKVATVPEMFTVPAGYREVEAPRR